MSATAGAEPSGRAVGDGGARWAAAARAHEVKDDELAKRELVRHVRSPRGDDAEEEPRQRDAAELLVRPPGGRAIEVDQLLRRHGVADDVQGRSNGRQPNEEDQADGHLEDLQQDLHRQPTRQPAELHPVSSQAMREAVEVDREEQGRDDRAAEEERPQEADAGARVVGEEDLHVLVTRRALVRHRSPDRSCWLAESNGAEVFRTFTRSFVRSGYRWETHPTVRT